MRLRLPILLGSCLCFLAFCAPAQTSASYQIFAGFTSLSNSINGVPGARQPLLGWETALNFPAWHHLRPVIDYTAFRGSNLGAPQHPYFIQAGGEYDHAIGRENLFGEALFGDVGINRNWGANGSPGSSASFSPFFGGGLDTPISKNLAVRVQGGYAFTNFALYQSVAYEFPYRIPGLPKNFARLSTGLVWTPYLRTVSTGPHQHRPVPSELVSEYIGSFGHFHLFAVSWWSNIHLGGLEYDRNSWGKRIGAQMDYTADILPVTILTQPTRTDVWGDTNTASREHVGGLAISPIGLRMMWFADRRVKPYFFIKGGLIGFTQKALSVNASYYNFTLQESLGLQFKLTDRWDMRTGFEFFHFSDGFVVPSNPGLDSLTYNFGISYHLGSRSTGR